MPQAFAFSNAQAQAVIFLFQFYPEPLNQQQKKLNRKLHFSDVENEEEDGDRWEN